MSARIAHIYAPSYRAVCASMSNENELVTSLAQNRTDDLDAPFAISDAVHCIRSRSALQPSPQCTATVPAVHCLHRERKGTLLQNTSSAQPWNANDRFEGLDWTHTHIYIYNVKLGLCNGLYELDVLRAMMKLSSRGIGWFLPYFRNYLHFAT